MTCNREDYIGTFSDTPNYMFTSFSTPATRIILHILGRDYSVFLVILRLYTEVQYSDRYHAKGYDFYQFYIFLVEKLYVGKTSLQL